MAEPTATDAPAISTADNDAAADAFVRAIAIERGVRTDPAVIDELMSFNFKDDSDFNITGSPQDQDRFMRVLRRAMVVDPGLEGLIQSAQGAGIPLNIEIGQQGHRVAFGSAGTRISPITGRDPATELDLTGPTVAGDTGRGFSMWPETSDTVFPLSQRIDMDDIEALSPMMRTDNVSVRENQEIAIAHEVRELIVTSFITDARKLNTEAGRKVFHQAHENARAAEDDIRVLTSRTGRPIRRLHNRGGGSRPHADSPAGTDHVMRFDYNDGSQIEIDMSETSTVLGVRETSPPNVDAVAARLEARRRAARQGSN